MVIITARNNTNITTNIINNNNNITTNINNNINITTIMIYQPLQGAW